MAQTIYGCVNWPAGTIHFTEGACTHKSACIEWTGAHAGQVALTITNALCDDTYYGCVNWSTGKFQVVVPDDCCPEWDGSWCGYCSGDDFETPKYVTVYPTGFTTCTRCYAASGNECFPASGIYLFRYRDVAAAINGNSYALTHKLLMGTACWWYQEFTGSFGYIDFYQGMGCATFVGSYPVDKIVFLYRVHNGYHSMPSTYCRAHNSTGPPGKYPGQYCTINSAMFDSFPYTDLRVTDQCVGGTLQNTLNCTGSGWYDRRACYDGQIEIKAGKV